MINSWLSYFFPFLTIAGLIILYYTLKNLLPSYFTEKGKNLATKEDISQLTQLVETVKFNFTKETEHLKSNLQFLNNLHGNLVSEERNTIIDYNEKYFNWLNLILDTGFDNIDDSNNEEIDKFRTKISQYYTSFLNSHSRFNLFIDNEELKEYAHRLKIDTLHLLGGASQIYLLKVKNLNTDLKLMKEHTPLEEQVEKQRVILEEGGALFTELNDAVVKNYRIIAPMTATFQKMCREYIYKILKNEKD
jgi:hypothetical protein